MLFCASEDVLHLFFFGPRVQVEIGFVADFVILSCLAKHDDVSCVSHHIAVCAFSSTILVLLPLQLLPIRAVDSHPYAKEASGSIASISKGARLAGRLPQQSESSRTNH